MRRSWLRGLRLLLLLAALTAAGAAPATAAGREALEVRLTATGFSPDFLWVPVGEEVRWVNASGSTQTLLGEDGTWDSGPLRPGEVFTLVPRLVGTVRYGTADGSAEGQLAVVEPVEVAAPVVVAPAVAALPDTGPPTALLLSCAAALLAGGFAALRAAARLARTRR